MGRAPCCDKANVKRGPWSPEEDAALRSYLEKNGTGGNWIALPQKAGLRRCGKSCRLRWLNYLRPDIKHGCFTEEEDGVICSLYKSIGSRWSVIASHLPGRTDNDVKNHWNTKLKKKLFSSSPPQQHQNCSTMSTTKSSAQASPSPPIPAVKSESCDGYFGGFSAPLILSEPIYQLPDFSATTAGYIMSPTPPDDMSAASSSSMTMDGMGVAGAMGSTAPAELLDWGGLHGWIGEGEHDLIFGGNLWSGGYS